MRAKLTSKEYAELSAFENVMGERWGTGVSQTDKLAARGLLVRRFVGEAAKMTKQERSRIFADYAYTKRPQFCEYQISRRGMKMLAAYRRQAA